MGAINYSTFGQNLQSTMASNALFWMMTIALVFFIIVVIISGFKRVASPGRLKWLLLHSLSIFLVGYFLRDFVFNKYLVVFIFAFFVTLLSTIYRYFMFRVKDTTANRGNWLVVNLLTFLVIQILYEVLLVTDPTLKIFFASFCLTLVGSLIHRDFKPTSESAPSSGHQIHNGWIKIDRLPDWAYRKMKRRHSGFAKGGHYLYKREGNSFYKKLR